MEDPLWRCMDSTKTISREQLELVIQKKKISEVHNWFQEHFAKCSHAEYLARCPIVILQGPTGCGKTSVLKWISNDLKAPIKEYSETTDITAINYDLAKAFSEEERANLSQSIDRRKALKFEHFVINSIRYNTLYPAQPPPVEASADSEFDSDDGFVEMVSSSRPPPKPPVSGVIIHIETPLTFARTQRILIQSLCRLLKVIKDISKHLLRRVAIVFETLEGDSETISLPTKMKLSLGIQVFKFNPVIRANMKKLIESLLNNYKHILLDKETIDQLVNDCDGDIRACINTLQIICNRTTSTNVSRGHGDGGSFNEYFGNNMVPFNVPASKKQKLHHEKVRQVRLSPSLMRDNTRSLGFFHVLGKIFYQKRIYPDPDSLGFNHQVKPYHFRSVDRPFPTENSTEYLASMLAVDPKNLIAWLHQHYYKFCHESNIEKAALYLENLSTIDTISLSSTQSSQFYEMHNTLEQLQVHLAIESTVFSLYEDQSNSNKTSHNKKKPVDKSNKLVKSSVYNCSNHGELYSFNKPVTMSLYKLVEDYQSLLDSCTHRLMEFNSSPQDPTKVLVDYVPYVNQISKNRSSMNSGNHLFDDETIMRIFETLERNEEKLDFDTRHEKLLEMIEAVRIA